MNDFNSIRDAAHHNTDSTNISNRTANLKKLSWLYFTKCWSNETHRDEIYVGDIFEHSHFLYRIEQFVLPEKTFKKFSEQLYSAVWGEFYGRYQFESMVTSWPLHIYGEKLAPLFDKAMNENNIDLDEEDIPGEKVSVGEIIFLNWTPFVEYVWNNKKILKEMIAEMKKGK